MSKSTPKSTLSPAVPATTETEALAALRACLAGLDGIAATLAGLAKLAPGSDARLQHLRESAAAALDGLRPEVEYLRKDVATASAPAPPTPPVPPTDHDTPPPARGVAAFPPARKITTAPPMQAKVLRGWPASRTLRMAA